VLETLRGTAMEEGKTCFCRRGALEVAERARTLAEEEYRRLFEALYLSEPPPESNPALTDYELGFRPNHGEPGTTISAEFRRS
jgi:hypothetical protein